MPLFETNQRMSTLSTALKDRKTYTFSVGLGYCYRQQRGKAVVLLLQIYVDRPITDKGVPDREEFENPELVELKFESRTEKLSWSNEPPDIAKISKQLEALFTPISSRKFRHGAIGQPLASTFGSFYHPFQTEVATAGGPYVGLGLCYRHSLRAYVPPVKWVVPTGIQEAEQ
ncbi:hypothetical protein Aperf_G00000101351 [Anoplocephala perfoliata]